MHTPSLLRLCRPALTPLALVAFLAFGCDEHASSSLPGAGGAPSEDGGSGGVGGGSDPVVDNAPTVRRLLQGDFDSSAQSVSEPSYFAIRLRTCRLDAPELGGQVLYVEQAMTDSLDAPYRQRVYVIEADPALPGGVVSHVLELKHATLWVGACDAEPVRSVTPAETLSRDGCEVHLVPDSAGGFVGGTIGHGCESSLHEASYATSEVSLSEAGLTSWDRGFDANDVQVWGAVAGPYRFDRKTPLPAD